MANSRISPATHERIAAAWDGVLDKIAAGELIGETIKRAGFSREMVRAYLRDTPGAREEWNEAREASADALYDQVLAIADNPGSDPKAARVKLQALMWAAGVRNPRVYGNKASMTLDVRTVDLTAIISAANARLEAQRMLAGGRTLEGISARVPEGVGAIEDLL